MLFPGQSWFREDWWKDKIVNLCTVFSYYILNSDLPHAILGVGDCGKLKLNINCSNSTVTQNGVNVSSIQVDQGPYSFHFNFYSHVNNSQIIRRNHPKNMLILISLIQVYIPIKSLVHVYYENNQNNDWLNKNFSANNIDANKNIT